MYNIISYKKWAYNYTLVKKEFWSVLGVFVLFVMVLVFACNKSSKSVDFDEIFNSAVKRYETEHAPFRFYEGGLKPLRKACINCKSEDEVYSIILQNEKWFKK